VHSGWPFCVKTCLISTINSLHDKLTFRALQQQEEPPFELLLLADPSQDLVEAYLVHAEVFLAEIERDIIGVVVLCPLEPGQYEIKNIAVSPAHQGQGVGQFLIKNAIQMAHQMGIKSLRIGTANSSIAQLYLYQKMGFELKTIQVDFFLENYAEPIFENGLQAKHLLILEMSLG
jgi:ribosomal protein S18 acetylase RimI-like enzyme